jgi:hypothetical protein
MVIMIAITPSLKASSLFLFILMTPGIWLPIRREKKRPEVYSELNFLF